MAEEGNERRPPAIAIAALHMDTQKAQICALEKEGKKKGDPICSSGRKTYLGPDRKEEGGF